MLITSIGLKSFRCFTSHEVLFAKPVVLIEGPNGSGKTSLLEALHYACYLKSFKTRSTRELVQDGAEAFSVKVQLKAGVEDEQTAHVSVGYSPARRSIKINDCPVKTYKELVNTYRVVAITDDDVQLIKGEPEIRRSFLDQAIALIEPEYAAVTRRYAAILEQRNALLASQRLTFDSYQLWTEQLIQIAGIIREKRQEVLAGLEKKLNSLIDEFFEGTDFTVQLVYRPREMPDGGMRELLRMEQAARRTLFGAHLDDYGLLLAQKRFLQKYQSSRLFASRGQQKLLTILLKLAQPAVQAPESCAFLLDDCISDLDYDKLGRLFTLLVSYKTQIILTTPLANAPLQDICNRYDYQSIVMPK